MSKSEKAKIIASNACLALYESCTRNEIKNESIELIIAWSIGKKISELLAEDEEQRWALMFGRYKYWLQFKIINFGIWLLPEEFRTEKLISNCMKTGHIKVKRDLERK